MLQECKRRVVLTRQTLLVALAIPFGFGFIGFIAGQLLYWNGTASVPLGGILFFTGTLLAGYMLCMGGFGSDINTALRFGSTRRQFFASFWLLCFVVVLALLALSNLLMLAEELIMGLPGTMPTAPLQLVLYALSTVATGCLSGILLLRLGRGALFIPLVLGVAVMLLGSQWHVAQNPENQSGIAQFVRWLQALLDTLPVSAKTLGNLAAVVILMLATWLLVRKVPVSD